MDLWFDPSRQIIVDKNDWKHPFYFYWVCLLPIFLIPDRKLMGGTTYVV